MGTYLLVFKSDNKEQIIKHIKSFKNWAKIKEDVWCINTSLNSKSIRDNFTSLLKEGQDLLFVINIDESGWTALNLPTDVVKWLKNAL